MSEPIDRDRRRFVAGALISLALAPLPSFEQIDQRRSGPSRTGAVHPPLGPVKQIDAGDLDVGYVEAGDAAAPAVILLHGWPYDIHSFDEVVPSLAASGHRVIVPYLRGFRNHSVSIGSNAP